MPQPSRPRAARRNNGTAELLPAWSAGALKASCRGTLAGGDDLRDADAGVGGTRQGKARMTGDRGVDAGNPRHMTDVILGHRVVPAFDAGEFWIAPRTEQMLDLEASAGHDRVVRQM